MVKRPTHLWRLLGLLLCALAIFRIQQPEVLWVAGQQLVELWGQVTIASQLLVMQLAVKVMVLMHAGLDTTIQGKLCC